VPNSMLLNVAVIPLREPERVDLRARFSADTTPLDVQDLLARSLEIPTRYAPHVELEELDRDELASASSLRHFGRPTARSWRARCLRPSATQTAREPPRL